MSAAPAVTPAHLKPHVDNLSAEWAEVHENLHKEEHHKNPQDFVLKAIHNTSMQFLQLAAQAKKDFPDAQKHHFYRDLEQLGKSGEQAAKKFFESKPAFVEQGLDPKVVVLALEGEMIAIIALFDVLKAQDKEYQKHAGHIEEQITGMLQRAIDVYSK
ncbi:hypothetical protein HWV62_6177 [Athelia sp. TMB]|nr:hypothetical protein HWV62_6177 [Athelia sp. TMB]